MTEKNIPIWRFEVLAPSQVEMDQGCVPLMGLELRSIDDPDERIILPCTFESAKRLSDEIAKRLMLLAPELYFGPRIAKRLKNGTLTLEQVKKRI